MNKKFLTLLQKNPSLLIAVLLVVVVFYSLFSQERGRSDACQRMNNETERTFCYLNAALNEKKVELCKKLEGNQRESCRLSYAIHFKDLATCELMTRSAATQFCITLVAFAKRDDEICKKIRDISYRDLCYERISVQDGNPALCDLVVNVSVKAECSEDARAASVVQEAQRTR